MQRFLRSHNRFTATLRTGNIRHLTQGVRNSFDHCRKLEANNVQQSRGTPTTILTHNAVFKEIEGRWSKRLQEQSTAMYKIFGEIQVARINLSKTQEASLLNRCEICTKVLDRKRTRQLNSFNELRQQHEKEAETLVRHNSDLLVGFSLLCLITGCYFNFSTGCGIGRKKSEDEVGEKV